MFLPSGIGRGGRGGLTPGPGFTEKVRAWSDGTSTLQEVQWARQ